jgi:hypothetical protein
MQANTLRPGLLVSLKTSSRGNVRYDKVDLDAHADGAAAVATWETTRTIADQEEYERAKKAQGRASTLIRRVCSVSAFGLLCPESNADALEEAIREAQGVVDSFNATATLTRIACYVIVGRVAQDDAEAVRAINSEVRELLDDMARGVDRLDVMAIRNAANKARQLGGMLTPSAQSRVQIAIDTARSVARKIAAAGETAALEVDSYAVRMITEQRTAFLDMREESAEVKSPEAESRAIDFAPMTTE